MQPADPGRASRPRKPRPRGEIGPRPDRGLALILGAIIAGGRATRFGGDKGAALLDGIALIDHARLVIAPFVGDMVIVGRDWAGLDVIADRPAPGLGPLGGIGAATAEAARRGAKLVLTIGCDMPRVPAALIAALVEQAPAFCVDAPILAVWPADAADALIAHLAAGGDGSVRRWAIAAGMAAVPAPSPLPNVNTPSDLAL